MLIRFPKNNNRYYNTHYKYVFDILQYGGNHIEFYNCEYFIVYIDNKRCLFDYSDFFTMEGYDPKNFDFVFKFHKHRNEEYPDNIIAFSPISFYEWNKFENMNYNFVNNKCISMRQKSYGNAIKRRDHVRNMLVQRYGNKRVKTRIVDQELYFLDIEDNNIAIFVPGAQENMLDRAQFQYMALGMPTISPWIPEELPFVSFVHSVDYILCNNEYTDLINQIELFLTKPDLLKVIGAAGRLTFRLSSTAIALNAWIFKTIKGSKNECNNTNSII